jgi:hypothetical protein
MPELGHSGDSKVRASRRYLYEPSAANDHEAFHYDLTDALGHDTRNKLLSNYLATKKGNCVTMPLLFVILGQRLGIDLTLATAPKYLLVRFNSQEYGQRINLEATSVTCIDFTSCAKAACDSGPHTTRAPCRVLWRPSYSPNTSQHLSLRATVD